MECSRLTRRRTLGNQKARPCRRRESRRQEDCIICHQRKGWWGCGILTGLLQCVIEGQGPPWELSSLDECEHGSTGLWGRRITRLADAEQAEVIKLRHGAPILGIYSHQSLMQKGDWPLKTLQAL